MYEFLKVDSVYNKVVKPFVEPIYNKVLSHQVIGYQVNIIKQKTG